MAKPTPTATPVPKAYHGAGPPLLNHGYLKLSVQRRFAHRLGKKGRGDQIVRVDT